MRRKRKIAPFFPTHPPFNAVTGEFASLSGEEGLFPNCALMQVAAADTYDNYVICRGFDTRMLVFIDYEAGNPEKPGIAVAKPYGNRKPGVYAIGEIYPAMIPAQGTESYMPPSPSEINFRLGQNPGVVVGPMEDGGQPSDLNSAIVPLFDHNGIAVSWMLIDGGSREEEEPCEDLGLSPGSYPAVAGATIAAGATGPVTYDGVIYQAKNHSQCEVKIGDMVGFHISPNCSKFFVPCVCCESPSEPGDPPCCDKFVAICVAGYTQIVPVACQDGDPWGNTATWSLFPLRQCCQQFSDDTCSTGFTINETYVAIKLCCTESTVTAYLAVTCGLPPYDSEDANSRTFNWSGLCAESPTTQSEDLVLISEEGSLCALKVKAAVSASSVICDPCEPEPAPSECCEQSLYFCYNNNSQLLPVDGGSYTWSVPGCCPGPAADLEVELSCDPETDTITMSGKYICNEEEFPFSETTEMSKFCDSGQARIIILDNIPCLIQMLVSTVQFNCAPVPGDETTTPPVTTPPPPPPMEI